MWSKFTIWYTLIRAIIVCEKNVPGFCVTYVVAQISWTQQSVWVCICNFYVRTNTFAVMYRICSCKLLFWWCPLGTPPWNKNQVDVILRNHGPVGGGMPSKWVFTTAIHHLVPLEVHNFHNPTVILPSTGSSCELGKLTTKLYKQKKIHIFDIFVLQLNCADDARINSKLFLGKRGYAWWFGVALSVAGPAGGKSLSDNDLDGWIEGFFVSQKSARLSHGLRLSCTCFMMKCRGYQSLAWFYIVISFFIGFSDHRHSNLPALGLMNLHYCNQTSQELMSLLIQSYYA